MEETCCNQKNMHVSVKQKHVRTHENPVRKPAHEKIRNNCKTEFTVVFSWESKWLLLCLISGTYVTLLAKAIYKWRTVIGLSARQIPHVLESFKQLLSKITSKPLLTSRLQCESGLPENNLLFKVDHGVLYPRQSPPAQGKKLNKKSCYCCSSWL